MVKRLWQIGSTPFPQLFPHLNKSLYLARAWKTVVDEAAIAVGRLIELPHGRQAEMREVVSKFLEILLAQHLLVPPIWTPSHAGEFYSVRVLFATKPTARLMNALDVFPGC